MCYRHQDNPSKTIVQNADTQESGLYEASRRVSSCQIRSLRNPINRDLRQLYDNIIYVKVGPEEVSFGIHKGLLSYVSSYFKAALNGNFKEATDGVIKLPDEDPAVFKRFNGWLYTHVFDYKKEKADNDLTFLMELYVFAEKRGIPSLQNAVIDTLITIYYSLDCVPCHEIAFAWKNTSEKSGLHSLLIDFYVHLLMMTAFGTPQERSMHPKDFLVEVILAFYKAKVDESINKKFDFWEKRCQYHNHEPDDPPCRGPMVP